MHRVRPALLAGAAIAVALLGIGCAETTREPLRSCPAPPYTQPVGVHIGPPVQSPEIRSRIDSVLNTSSDFQALRSHLVASGFSFEPDANAYITAFDDSGAPFVGFSYNTYQRSTRSSAFLVAFYAATDLRTESASSTYMYLAKYHYFQGPSRRYWAEGAQVFFCEEPSLDTGR